MRWPCEPLGPGARGRAALPPAPWGVAGKASAPSAPSGSQITCARRTPFPKIRLALSRTTPRRQRAASKRVGTGEKNGDECAVRDLQLQHQFSDRYTTSHFALRGWAGPPSDRGYHAARRERRGSTEHDLSGCQHAIPISQFTIAPLAHESEAKPQSPPPPS